MCASHFFLFSNAVGSECASVCVHVCPGTAVGDACHLWMPLWWFPQSVVPHYCSTARGIKHLYCFTHTYTKKEKEWERRQNDREKKCLSFPSLCPSGQQMTVSDSWLWHDAHHRAGTLAPSLTPCLQHSLALQRVWSQRRTLAAKLATTTEHFHSSSAHFVCFHFKTMWKC